MASQEMSKEIIDVRVKAAGIAERCKHDAEFVKQLVNNPRATLESAGIPAESVNEVLGVQGKELCGVSCIATDGCFLSIKACCGSGPC